MAGPIGRNDPCPCGSGRKWKRCCGANAGPDLQFVSQSEPVAGWARAHATWPKAREVLTQHSTDWLGADLLEACFDEFYGDEFDEKVREHWFPLFHSWQLYDWIPEGATQTVAGHWLAKGALDPLRDRDVQCMIESTNAQPLSFYQVQALDRGRGAVLRDLLTGDERFVVDRSLSESLPPWTVILARLAPFGNLTIFDVVGHRPLVPDVLPDLLEDVKDACGLSLPAFPAEVRRFAMDLIDLYRDAVVEDDERRSQRPILHTTDDELLVLCKETWRFEEAERAAVIEALGSAGFERDRGHSGPSVKFRWSRENTEGPLPSTLLGTITVTAGELALETNSRERRAMLKKKLEKALRARITHIGSEEREQAELFEAGVAEPAGGGESVPPEVAEQVIREFLGRHYATWPDSAIPALGGQTPREAMKTAKGRERVAALVNEMEHRSHGSPHANAYDFDDLRRELGLPAARGPMG
jgi:hypothetical protein